MFRPTAFLILSQWQNGRGAKSLQQFAMAWLDNCRIYVHKLKEFLLNDCSKLSP